jgi:ketosteroid isomerase-like protein
MPSGALGQADSGAEAAINEGAVAWQTGWNSGDAAAITALYSAEAIVLAPGAEAAEGQEAIQAGLAVALEMAGGSTMEITPGEIIPVGMDHAIEVGSFVETGADGSHKDHGKYLAVWAKVDGSWKIVRDIWNSSMPQ